MSNTKVLIVEDEILIAEDLRFILQRMGYQVIGTASSGIEAVRIADKAHPDLVLMDVRLQGAMDGIETARQIKRVAEIPIIYVTAHASTLASLEENDRCIRLAKPFSPSQLQDAINTALNDRQKQTQ